MNKEKCFKVLKNCLLEETAGAGNLMDEPIEFLIEVYCELTNTNKDDFITKLNIIKRAAWGEQCWRHIHNEWIECQEKYRLFIDTLEIK